MRCILASMVWAALFSAASGFPTPVPMPKLNMQEACGLVMKPMLERNSDRPPRWRNPPLLQSATYTTLRYSEVLRKHYPEESDERLGKTDKAWLLTEWGWLVTVISELDLSQSNTFFVRPDGEVVLLWMTE